MYRLSPSRNQRSKGIKVKYVLQICLLLAVCFWLIYQVKHSHDKKKEFDESDARGLLQEVSSDEIIKLGRKYLRPRVEKTTSKNQKHGEPAEEEEEETGEEVEENKHEEDEPEDNKVEDETDEPEQEKSDAKADREEELVDDEKEREIGDENETQETDSDDGNDQTDKEISTEESDHDGDDRITHEAREEHYKADDASSAVSHDTQISSTENENEHMENSTEQHPRNTSEEQNKENNAEETNKGEDRKDLVVEGGELAGDDHRSNVTASETKVDVLDNSEDISSSNNTVTEGLNDHLPSNSSTELTIQNHDSPSENVMGSEANNSTTDNFSPDSTDSTENKVAEAHSEEFSDAPTNNTIAESDNSVEVGNSTESLPGKNDEEKSDMSDGTDETLESTMTENPEEVLHETIDISDTSNSLEEKDVRMDLDTLPEIQTEGTNSEDVAAE